MCAAVVTCQLQASTIYYPHAHKSQQFSYTPTSSPRASLQSIHYNHARMSWQPFQLLQITTSLISYNILTRDTHLCLLQHRQANFPDRDSLDSEPMPTNPMNYDSDEPGDSFSDISHYQRWLKNRTESKIEYRFEVERGQSTRDCGKAWSEILRALAG
jgi:hypothetical protein